MGTFPLIILLDQGTEWKRQARCKFDCVRLRRGCLKGGFLCCRTLVYVQEKTENIFSTSAFTLFWFFFPNYLFIVFLSQILFSGTTFLNTVPNTFHSQALFKNQSWKGIPGWMWGDKVGDGGSFIKLGSSVRKGDGIGKEKRNKTEITSWLWQQRLTVI